MVGNAPLFNRHNFKTRIDGVSVQQLVDDHYNMRDPAFPLFKALAVYILNFIAFWLPTCNTNCKGPYPYVICRQRLTLLARFDT